MTNPLLDTAGLPLFDRIAPEHVAPAMDELLAQEEQRARRLADQGADVEALKGRDQLDHLGRLGSLGRLVKVGQRCAIKTLLYLSRS